MTAGIIGNEILWGRGGQVQGHGDSLGDDPWRGNFKERLGPSRAGLGNMTQGKVYLVGAGPDLVKKVGEFIGELKKATKTGC